MRLGEVNVKGDFGGDDDDFDVDKALADGKKLQQQAEDFREFAKDSEAEQAEAFRAAQKRNNEQIRANDEEAKSVERVSEARKKEIELQQRRLDLLEEYDQVSQNGARKTQVRNKEVLAANQREAEILREIIEIEQELGIKDQQRINRLNRINNSLDTYARNQEKGRVAQQQATQATEEATSASRRKKEATDQETASTRESTAATQENVEAVENLTEAVAGLDNAEQNLQQNRETRRTRRGGGGGGRPPGGGGGAAGGGGGLPPGGGGPPDPPDDDFDYTEFIQRIIQRTRQIKVEIRTAQGEDLRRLEREKRRLAQAEQFEEERAKLEDRRLRAAEALSQLKEFISGQDENDQATVRRLTRAFDQLAARIRTADDALEEGRGNVDLMSNSLRDATTNTENLIQRTDDENNRRRQAVEIQRERVRGQLDLLSDQEAFLLSEKESLRTLSARKEIEQQIGQIGRQRQALQLQLQRSDEISTGESERTAVRLEQLFDESVRVADSARESERIYNDLFETEQRRLEIRLRALRLQRGQLTDPSAITAINSQIQSSEDRLQGLRNDFENGRGSIDSLVRSLENVEDRIDSTLERTREQNEEYERQRQIVKESTRDLKDRIDGQRRVLEIALQETTNLESRRKIEKAISDLNALEERRQRNILLERFSPDQFSALAAEAEILFVRNNQVRRDGIDQEKEYNLEFEKQSKILKEIKLLLDDRDPLFKGGFTTEQINRAETELKRLKQELEDTANAGRSLDGLRRRIRDFGRDIETNRAPLNRFELALSRLRDRLGFLGTAFAALDSRSRGFSLFTSLATAIVEPLAAVVLQLGGGLLAVASSALAAGTALGGALVAGAAQALPVIALLAAGFKSLIDVVQISNRQRQDEASNAAREARGVGGAAQNVNRLADANENLVEAQRRLSDARRQAIRDLEDLADKERQAELAAQSATISVAEAIIALDQARATGSALDIRRAQIELAGARISERQAERDLGRTRFDTATQRAEGVEGSDQVVAAKRALTQAERSLADARTAGASAAGALSQATARLNEQIEDLSPGQRELLDGINRLREVFRSGPFVEIRDIILQPFVAATEALADLGGDNELVASFTSLANAISRTLGGAVQSVFSGRARDFLAFISEESAINVNILFRGFEALASVIGDIAIGAAPTFRDVLLGIVETLERIDRALSAESLTEFFGDLTPALDAFGQLTEETFLLLKNLFELSAPAGNTLVSTFATFIRSINQQLADPARRREIREWFDEVGEGVAAFGTALKDLTVAIFGGLNPDRLRQFSVVISDILAPAIETLITVSGRLFDILSLLEKVPLAKELTAITIATVVLGKTFSTILGITGLALAGFRNLAVAISGVATAAGRASRGGGLAGFSQGLLVFNSNARGATGGLAGFSRGLRNASGLAGIVRGLGGAIRVLGPFGLAAGIALTIFADDIVNLIPKIKSLNDEAKEASQSLLALSDAAGNQQDARIRLSQAERAQFDADEQRRQALRQLRRAQRQLENAETAKEQREARRLVEIARNEVERAQDSIDVANRAYEEAKKDLDKTARESAALAEQTAQSFFEAFDSTRRGTPGAFGTPARLFSSAERLEQLKAILFDDEDFANMDEYTRSQVLGIVETIVRTKGDITQKDLEIVFSGILDDQSIRQILKSLDIEIPKNINIKAVLNEKELSQQAEKAGTSVESALLNRLRILTDLTGVYAGKSRPAPAEGVAAQNRSTRDLADGGIVRATPGGVVIRAAEDGYDEFVITSDPTKRGKSRDILRRAARAILSEDPTQENDQYGVSEGDPPSLRGRGRGSAAAPPKSSLAGFFTMFRTAQEIDSQDIPYSWGGGHITPARPTTGIRSDGNDGTDTVGFDCSSSVSAVLQSAYPGFPTITSGEFPNQSIMNPGQGLVTIWSNNKHVFMTFGGEDWGTNSGDPGGGPGFHSHTRSGFTASYPDGLGPETNEPGLFGGVYEYLGGKSASEINTVEDQFFALGRSADNIPGVISNSLGDRNKSRIPLFFDVAAAAISDGLSLFQQFQNGGIVQGRTGQPQVVVAHAGEMVVDEQSARSLRDGRTSRDIIKTFVNSLKAAIKEVGPELNAGFRSFFRDIIGVRVNAGGLVDANKKLRGDQLGFFNNITVDNKPGNNKPGPAGGISRFNILEGALQFLADGEINKDDADARAIIGTTTKRIREALAKITNRFSGLVERLAARAATIVEQVNTKISSAQTQLFSDQLSSQGSFNAATGVFQFATTGSTFFERLTSQGSQSAASFAIERDSLISQRDDLIAARTNIETLINQTGDTIAALEAKRSALQDALSKLKDREKNVQAEFDKARKGSPKKARKRRELNRIKELIAAVQAELNSVNDQIQAARATQRQLEQDREGINAQITSTESQIASATGGQIDALIAQATSGRFTPQQAAVFLQQAEDLARQSGDQQRLDAIRQARFQIEQGQIGAQIGEQQALLRLADLTGDEAGRESALRSIGDLLVDQRESTQNQINELLAQGFSADSPEVIALRTALVNLDIAIRENTDALNGTTTQNFSSTAWQLFRRAIFSGESQLLPGFSDAFNLAVQPVTNPTVNQPDMVYTLPFGPESNRAQLPDKGDTTTNITVNVNEAQQTVDPTYLASTLAFALDGMP